MKFFFNFFLLTMGCFPKTPEKPCFWNFGAWKLGVISGEKVSTCPWLPCVELINATEKEACVRKRPGTCHWVRTVRTCVSFDENTIYCQRRRSVTGLFEHYVRTEYEWDTEKYTFKTTLVKKRQSVKVPNGRGCYYATFGKFFSNYERCGADLIAFPRPDEYRCWRDDGTDWSLYE